MDKEKTQKVKQEQVESDLNEKFYVYLVDNKDEVVGIHESETKPSKELLKLLIEEHREVYARAVSARVEMRYSL